MIPRIIEALAELFRPVPNFRSMNGSDIAEIAHVPTDKELFYWSVYFQAKDEGHSQAASERIARDSTLAKFFLYGKPAA